MNIPAGYELVDDAIPEGYEAVEDTPRAEGPGLARRMGESFIREGLPIAGLLAGEVAGAVGGPPWIVVGAGLGYGIGKGTANLILGENQQKTLGRSLLSGAKDVNTGMLTQMTGMVGGKVLGKGLESGGKIGKAAIGKMTGAGPGAAEEAVKGGRAFTDAMRGKISGEDVVQNAKDALNMLKERRGDAYRTQLKQLEGLGDLDTTPITNKVADLMKRYNITVGSDGAIDLSRTAVGRKGMRDLDDIFEVVTEWGKKPGDKTPLGLDTLKRQLDDFYSESSGARGFVAELRNEVKKTISKQVPKYDELTKGYSEATRLIKDVETDLMLRKQGMSGRVTADKTLRRLMSSMRDNFQLRKELVEVLGDQTGKDLSGEIGGLGMSEWLPRGLAGVPASMAGLSVGLQWLNPKFLPLITLSSPRVSGEFLRMLGKAGRASKGGSMAASKAAAYLTVPPAIESNR